MWLKNATLPTESWGTLGLEFFPFDPDQGKDGYDTMAEEWMWAEYHRGTMSLGLENMLDRR